VPFEDRDPDDGGMRQRHGRREFTGPDGEFNSEGFPQDFWGTPLQREIFPEDPGSRYYREDDCLPTWSGPLPYNSFEAGQLMEGMGRAAEEEEFWFRGGGGGATQDPFGYGRKMESEAVPENEETAAADEFDVAPPELADRPAPDDPALGLSEGAIVEGEIVGANLVHGLQVDLGASVDGVVPTWHDLGEIDSRLYEEHRDLWDEEVYPGRKVKVRVHAMRLHRMEATGRLLYRFPVELELLEPDLSQGLKPPLPKAEGDVFSPVKLWSYEEAEWREMFQVTGRRMPEGFSQRMVDGQREAHEWAKRDKLIQYRKRFGIADPELEDDAIPENSMGRASDPFAHINDEHNVWQLVPHEWSEGVEQVPKDEEHLLGGDGPAKEVKDLNMLF